MIYKYFPEDIRHIIKQAVKKTRCLEEIRIRCGQKIVFCEAQGKFFVNSQGNLTQNKCDGITMCKRQMEEMLRLITKNSMYAVQAEIKKGFVTLPDGSRVGLCGKCVTTNGKVEYIRDITSLNIRISREVKECATKIYSELLISDKNILIMSPPGHGKTTFLRDLVRLASEDGKNVVIIDERCEIAPFVDGYSIYDLGNNTDVLCDLPKSLGIDMALRTMNPQMIAVDEISTIDDFDAIIRAMYSGVKILATFHGTNKTDFHNKVSEKYVSKLNFDNFIYINKSASCRKIWYE